MINGDNFPSQRDKEVLLVRRRQPAWLLVLLLTLSLIAAACGGDDDDAGTGQGEEEDTEQEAEVRKGGTLRYAADQEPTGFNNNTSANNGTSVVNVMVRVWPSVFPVNPKFEPVLDEELMQSAELTKEDPQTLVYKINPDAVWSDGTPISADDMIYTWQMLNGTGKDIDGKPIDAASTTGYEDIASVTGTDDKKTVTVVFKKKFADWKGLWSGGGGIVPAHIGKKVGFNTGFDKFDPAVVISGGPFKVASYNQGRDLTLVQNERYWGTKPNLDSIVFRFIEDSAQQVPALKNNEVDMIYPQPQLDLVSEVRAIPDVENELNFGLSFEHLTLNFKNEHLKVKEVRQAMAKALDRDAIVKRTVGQFDPRAKVLNNRMYVNNQPEYKDNGAGYTKADVPGAEKLLQQAGYAKGPDGIYAKGGSKLSLRISTTSGNQLREDQGVLIQSQLKAAGIDIQIDNCPSTCLFGDRLPKGNFDIANFAWVSTPFASANKAIYETVNEDAGTGGSNYGSYSNPEVDRMMNAAIEELDEDEVVDAWNNVDKLVWADMATIPLYQKPTFLAVRETFANVNDNASSVGPFWNAEKFGLKADAQ